MNSFLTLPAIERAAVFTDVADKMGIPPFYVEKDFWVSWMLAVLFSDDKLSPHITFRGGTSLSKAYNAISRFSEDIDLSISRKWLGVTEAIDPLLAQTKSQAEKRQGKIRKLTRAKLKEYVLPLIEMAVTQCPLLDQEFTIEPEGEPPFAESRDPYCIYFTYPSVVESPVGGYISSRVKLEFSARAEGSPEEEKLIQSFVADHYPNVFEVPQVAVKTVLPTRTFWEKLFIIHEENTAPESREPKARLSRHYYDLCQIIEQGLVSHDIDLFKEVKNHRRHYFAQSWVDYDSLTIQDFQVTPPDRILKVWVDDYEAMKSMVYEPLPVFETAIQIIQSCLKFDE